MFKCIFDPGACIASGVHSTFAAVPWWGWVVIALLVIGLVWKLAGWPGIVALAALVGYIAGRRNWQPGEPIEHVDGPDAEPPPRRSPFPPMGRRPKTLEDLFREGMR